MSASRHHSYWYIHNNWPIKKQKPCDVTAQMIICSVRMRRLKKYGVRGVGVILWLIVRTVCRIKRDETLIAPAASDGL